MAASKVSGCCHQTHGRSCREASFGLATMATSTITADPALPLVRFQVLGAGELPPIPVVVKAKFFSKDAMKKIQAIGGACVLVA